MIRSHRRSRLQPSLRQFPTWSKETDMEDPVKVDPKHYKVELENDQVRVLRISYGPREKSVMHGHPDSLGVNFTDAHMKFRFPDGKTEEIRAKAGEVRSYPAGEHLPENLTDKPIEVVFVELKAKAS